METLGGARGGPERPPRRPGDRATIAPASAAWPVLPTAGPPADQGPDRDRFRRLPEPIRLADTVETSAVSDPPDPWFGRDVDRDLALLRAAG